VKLPSHYGELTEHELQRHIDRREQMIATTQSEIRALKKLLKQKEDWRKKAS